MEKADIKNKIHLALVALLISVQKVTGFSTSPSALTSCASSTANISFNFGTDTGESIVGKRTWYFSGGKIAESNGTTLTPVPRYLSRLTAYGTSGISLSNITVADAGTYTYVIVLLPTGSPYTAITALSVQVAPLAPPSGCHVSATQSGNILTCAVNTDSGNCGTPSLNAFWVNSTNTSSKFICNFGEVYQCCATSAALTCYSGSPNDFCKLFNCTDVTTTTTKPPQNNIGLELGLGLGLGITIVITIIVVVIFKYTGICNRVKFGRGILKGFVKRLNCTNDEDNPQELDEVSSVQTYVGSKANFNFMLTEDCNESAVLIKNKSGGVVLIARGKVGTSDDPFYKDRVNFTGNTNQKLISFILRNVTLSDAGIYIAVHSDANRIIGCQMLIVKDTKGKTKIPGSSSAVSREQVQVQMENKGVKDDDEERHPAVHTRIQNEVEPNTNSKQRNHRQQLVPLFCPQPPPPQNGKIKDQSLRGLASEIPRPSKLPPIVKQETIQEVDASEESKQKRKRRKKKKQVNEKTLEDENGETI